MNFRRLLTTSTITSLIVGAVAATSVVAEGSIDATWGSSGVLCTNSGTTSGFVRDAVALADGSILTIGYGFITTSFQVIVTKTLANGTPDASFGVSGTAALETLSAVFDSSVGYNAAVQPDGKIVIVGEGRSGGQNDPIVVRLMPTGALDNTFDGDGFLSFFPSINDDYAEGVVILPDGDIMVAGGTYQGATSMGDLFMARINSDGTLDSTFDGDGLLIKDFLGYSNEDFYDIVRRTDGTLLVGGQMNGSATVVAITPTGTVDNSFNSDGISRLTDIPGGRIKSIALQNDGKIVFGGQTSDGTSATTTVGRLSSNGDLDTSFNSTGYNRFLTSTDALIEDVVVQTDGKIAATGWLWQASDPTRTDVLTARLTSAGALDSSFSAGGTIGYVTSGNAARDDTGYATIVTSTGTIISAATYWPSTTWCMSLIKHTTTLAPSTWSDQTLASGLKNVAYSDAVASNLGAAATYTLQSGTLPTGISLAANGNLSGTPTATGAFPITIRATTGSGTLNLNTSLIVNQAPTLVDSTIDTGGIAGTPYSNQVSATGYPTPSYSVTAGSLPNGITLDANTGAITGTPTVGGNFPFTISANNGIGSPVSFGSMYIMIVAAPIWTDQTVASARVGVPFTDAISASGYPTPSFSKVSGNLPPGINPNSNGTLSGTPLAAGTFTFTMQAQNARGTVTTQITIVVEPNNTFTPVTPARVADTRDNTGGVGTTKIGNGADGGTPLTFRVLGTGNIPTSGVAAVSLNVTAVDGQVGDEGGYVTVYPCATGRPNVSNLNFTNRQTIPNAVIVPVDTNGNICVYVYGRSHIIIDVNGWFG